MNTDKDHLSAPSGQAVRGETGRVKERPILFSAPMVRALLAGTKTQTRRALRAQPDSHHWESIPGYELKRSKIVTINERCAVKFSHSIPQNRQWDTALDWLLCPYGQPGDRLWVREAHYFTFVRGHEREGEVIFRADHGDAPRPPMGVGRPWRPSIHMPRWASRILLEVTDVRVERLQDISEEDAKAEGVAEWAAGACAPGNPNGFTPVDYYELLWSQINGRESWDANPWVWCVSFRPLTA